MGRIRRYSTGKIENPPDVIPCIFRGKYVNCTRSDIAEHRCDTCGWNPIVEADREAKLKKGAEHG